MIDTMEPLSKKRRSIDKIELKEEQRSFLPSSKNDRRCSSLESSYRKNFDSKREAMSYLAKLLIDIGQWRARQEKYDEE